VTSGSQEDALDTTASGTTLVDRSFGEHRQGYDLTEIRRVDGKLLRARIYALIEVFTPVMTWTQLASEPASTWHAATPRRATSPAPLDNLAERLFQRG
jgi:hypothetical protein